MSLAEIRFQLDEHMQAAVAAQLRQRGIDALTAHEAELRGATDAEHLRPAVANNRVLVTADDDFLSLIAAGVEHGGIVYFPGGVGSVGEVVNALVLVHGVYTAEDMVGRIEFF